MRARRFLVALGALTISLSLIPAVARDPLSPVGEALGICDPIDPAACLLPWPNDFFTTPDPGMDTGRRLNLSLLAMPRNVAGIPIDPTDYNRNDGFSPGALIVTRVPGLDTPEALVNTNPVGLTDLARYADPDAPVVVLDAETGERHPIWVELDRSEEITGDGDAPASADTTLLIRPAINFDEATRYVVALRFLRDAGANLIAPQPTFRSFRDGTGPLKRQPHMNGLFDTLEQAGIARDDLYLAWDFTVASERNLSERMLHIRDDAFRQLGDIDLDDLTVQGRSPQFVVDEITPLLPCRPEIDIDVPPISCDTDQTIDARVARRVEGRVVVPCYLNLPGCVTGSRFLYPTPSATLPVRIPGNIAAANFICNIPAGALEGQTYRPSLYGHGLLGGADSVNSGKLYDLAQHGLLFCATDWIGMASEDIANAASLLLEIGRFPTLADRVQQGMLNFLYLGRTMIHPEGFCSHAAFRVNGSCVIDTSRLYYNGGSQGGIIGGSLTAVAPDFTQAHLGVPGMNYSTLLNRSVDFDVYAQLMYRAYPNTIERQLILSMIQTFWDRAESNGYAHHMTTDPYENTPAHRVLLTPAFGDHQVTNWATDVMARTVGATMRVPAVDPGRHPAGANAYWGIGQIGSYPFAGSATVVAEIGPLRMVGDRERGTSPPPLDNVPNRSGVDPHGPDWSEQADGKLAIGTFLSPLGWLPAVCGSAPCYLDGWAGP